MATTTPNYGWAVPTSTDLVKDGATAIETLGDAIDASMNTALGTKKAMGVLLNTTTFSGVSSISTSAFATSTYDVYRVVIKINSASTGASLEMRLRNAGSDLSTNVYDRGYGSKAYNGGAVSGNQNVNSTVFSLGEFANSSNIYTFDINDMATAVQKTMTGTYASLDFFGYFGGRYNTGSVADALTLIPSTGTITGSVSVYGYNK